MLNIKQIEELISNLTNIQISIVEEILHNEIIKRHIENSKKEVK